ncbi:uncharacterized protein LOC143259838 [Megalopta genalis]|uniref:uncharacterized protein LOC143259838 n=1 Tax=Megalopta genalis TaxID=115081 RepID=UPI003FD37011
MTAAQISEFHTATHCHVCEELFGDRDLRVRDHCHFTGTYHGPAHNNYNLGYRSSFVVPVFFHNLSGYDAHFVIKELANAFEGKIDVLPLTKENLDKLSSYLHTSDLRILGNQFGQICDDDFHLLTRKGVFPYDYVATYDILSDTRLPPREAFYSELYDSEISDFDYCHASEVWSRFNIQTLGQYSDLYLKVDVLLLADVFENFREMSLDNYSLDPAHYYMLPGFAWDTMLQMTKIEGFRWVDDASDFNVDSVPIDSPVGYILEVDLEYPQEIHVSHSDLPFCPIHEARALQKKLLATQCLRHNLKLKRIHRILEFEQSSWLRAYIDLNTRLRASANTDFSRNLFTLMSNAVFGKTMENLSIKFYKPVYIGMSVLDISKLRLYYFHYSYMLPNFQKRCKILYTDTDSLIYRIACNDAYETIKRDIDRCDTSNYDRDNAYGVPIANNKVIGLMKDENGGRIMTEFVGLRSKMYAIQMKLALSPYDDKRYITSNSIDTLPWGHYDIARREKTVTTP